MSDNTVIDIIEKVIELIDLDADTTTEVKDLLEQAVIYINLTGVAVELATNIYDILKSDDMSSAERTNLILANKKRIAEIQTLIEK